MRILTLLFIPLFLMANDDTDIVPRTINFFIFVAIMYYLLATPVKNFYNSRIESISNRLKKIEDGLEEARKSKELSSIRIEKANKDSEDLISLAKEQAKKISEQINNNTIQEVKNLEKQFEEQKIFEEKKVKNEVVEELLRELLDEKIALSQDELLSVVSRKVS